MTAAPDPYDELVQLVTTLPEPKLRAFMAALDDDDVALVERIMAERRSVGWRRDPATMAAYLTGGEYRADWRYVALLSAKFVEAVDGKDPRQLWNLPSQYGKTTLLCTYGVPWLLQRNPRLRVMYVTYDADKAVEEGGKARDFIEEHAGELGVQLRRDRRARGMWRTEQGGGLYAVGIFGGIVGWPVDVMLLDDLMKGWQQAHSEAQRDAVWSIYRSQVRLRIQGQACPIIAAGTRWHEDDPSGRMLDPPDVVGAEHFTHIRLPALADSVADPIGRELGEPLEPERFDLAEVQARAATLGSYLTSALEQQHPTPEEGNELLRAWFQLEEQLPTAPDDALTSWDFKLKNREEGDYVVGQAWWRVGSGFWCIDQLRGQWDHATTANAVALLAVRHPEVQRHVVEAAGSADEVLPQLKAPDPDYVVSDDMAARLGMNLAEREAVQQLRRRGLSGVQPKKPEGDKRVRARSFIAPVAEAQDVHLPASAPWVPHWLDEHAAFPNATHDDQVDACSQALKWLNKAPGTLVVRSGRRTAAPGRRGMVARRGGGVALRGR